MVGRPLLSCIQLIQMVLGLTSCIASLMDGGAQSYQHNRGGHLTYMPILWQDNIIRAGIYDCTQEVHWYFSAEYFKKRCNK